MALITLFHDLPDLVFLELFTYLSQIDIVLAFANLNNRFRALVTERGFFVTLTSRQCVVVSSIHSYSIAPIG